jgi:hypothetical protein
MSGLAAPLPRYERGALPNLLGVVATCAAIVLAAVGVNQLASGGTARPSVPLYSGPGKSFRIALPKGWHAAQAPMGVTTLLRRDDHRGVILVRPAPKLEGTPAQVTRTLAAQLRKAFRGFTPVGARVARVRGGSAIAYTFVRDPAGTVQTLMIAPAHGRLWEVDAVMPGSAPDVARQAGSMLATFGT